MGMNARAVIKGLAFSSVPNMALFGRYRSQGGTDVQNKKGSGVQSSRRRAGDLCLGSCGHMISHMTKPCPEQSLPGPYLHR